MALGNRPALFENLKKLFTIGRSRFARKIGRRLAVDVRAEGIPPSPITIRQAQNQRAKLDQLDMLEVLN